MFNKIRCIALLWLVTAIAAAPPMAKGDCRAVLNTALQAALLTVADPLELNTLSSDIKVPQMADLLLTLADPVLSGFKGDLKVTACSSNEEKPGDKKLVNIVLEVESMTLKASNLSLDGTLVDHVPVFGGGPANIDILDLKVTLMGNASNFNIGLSPVILMDDLTLDLELTRWIMETDGLMPGTDLDSVFDEFISMVGPELFDVLEMKWNNNGNPGLLNLINGLFPPAPPKLTQ